MSAKQEAWRSSALRLVGAWGDRGRTLFIRDWTPAPRLKKAWPLARSLLFSRSLTALLPYPYPAAKNLALMGVKSVILFDPEVTTWSDLSGNFYLSPSDVGTPRARACVARVAELNPLSAIDVLSEPTVDAAVVARFNVVVLTDVSESEARRIGALARAAGVRLVLAESAGLFGRVFCDFGDAHVVDDADGEPPAVGHVCSISSEADGIVTLHPDMLHGLSNGDFVTFHEVRGLSSLNNAPPRRVRYINKSSFSIGETRGDGPATYQGGGIFTQAKQPLTLSFAPLADMLGGGVPEAAFLGSDFGKLDRAPVLHAAFTALHARGGAPAPGDDLAAVALADAAALIAFGPVGAQDVPPPLAAVLLAFARGAAGHLSPLCATLGGIAAQEAIKAITGKFTPIHQWLYMDAAEAAPIDALPAADLAPRGDRYDGQTAVFGRAFQEKIGALRYFLVGAGAIGCEVLKNWAAMGVGCGPGGRVTVTDMDRVERSNLSRQFLFRARHIGQPKSSTAVAAAAGLNAEMRAEAFETRVGPDSEGLFDDAFWDGLSGVCNALDNVEARRYVDARCVHYGRSLLESGTLGSKGNTQVIVPRLTENYGATQDPPEKGFAVCTIKSFPYQIEHTLQFARDWFEGEFRNVPDAINAYLSNPDFLDVLAEQPGEQIATLEKVSERVVQECKRMRRGVKGIVVLRVLFGSARGAQKREARGVERSDRRRTRA